MVPVLTYGSETIIWKENDRSRIWTVQINNLRGLLGIRRRDKVPNARIRQLCRVAKGVDENIYEGILRCFGHMERIENDRIAKRVYVGECAGSRSVGRSRKTWIDTVKDCLKKRGLDNIQERIMMHDRSEWRGLLRKNAWGIARGMNL